MNNLVIQFVAADPFEKTRLGLPEEMMEIQRKIQSSPPRGHRLVPAPAANLEDVIFALQNNRPNCVHFSCHGTQFSKIVLFNGKNEAEPLSQQTVGLLFNTLRGRIRLVTLSCCHSEDQASKIAEMIDCVIGIRGIVEPAAAAAYSAAFYGQLANKQSVADAHNLALITFSHHNPRNRSVPQLFPRAGIDPHTVFPGIRSSLTSNNGAKVGEGASTPDAPPERHRRKSYPPDAISVSGVSGTQTPLTPVASKSKQYRLAKQAFEENRDRYGIWAEELSIVKTASIDGTATVSYRITGLHGLTQNIKRIYFDINTTAGLVSNPRLDSQVDNPTPVWKPIRCKEAESARGVIDRLGSIRGYFVKSIPYAGASSNPDGYSFGWTVLILNCDAVTTWEFNNLYARNQQRHVDDSLLPGPQEYFAALIWFPVKKLIINLSLPQPSELKLKVANSSPPTHRLFHLKSSDKRPIPINSVVAGDTLYLRPNPTSLWNARNRHWEPVSAGSDSLSTLVSRPDGTSTLTVHYPALGSYTSLDWEVMQLHVRGRFDSLIRTAEHLRSELLEHRICHRSKKSNPQTKAICDRFHDLHLQLWDRYDGTGRKHKFETALFVWNDAKKRLEMVEGFVNGRPMPAQAWEFWLPFGLGLAGASFRTAKAQIYRRPLDPSENRERENYLELPEQIQHECLVSLPMDHPSLFATDVPALGPFRSRQLVGVVTIGTAYKASGLCSLCRDVIDKGHWEAAKDLQSLRDECQATCDSISDLILNKPD
jgi:hypothetical protein